MSPLTPHDLGLLTLGEASEIAGFPVATMRVWIVRYHLAFTRVLGEVMISELAFYDCEKARRDTPQGRAARRVNDRRVICEPTARLCPGSS